MGGKTAVITLETAPLPVFPDLYYPAKKPVNTTPPDAPVCTRRIANQREDQIEAVAGITGPKIPHQIIA